MTPHVCRRPHTCCCCIRALEPHPDCPFHGGGEWPPRCVYCGRFLPCPRVASYAAALANAGPPNGKEVPS